MPQSETAIAWTTSPRVAREALVLGELRSVVLETVEEVISKSLCFVVPGERSQCGSKKSLLPYFLDWLEESGQVRKLAVVFTPCSDDVQNCLVELCET